MRKTALSFALTVLALLLIPAAAIAAGSSLVLSPDSGPVGTEVHVAGKDLPANAPFYLNWYEPLGDVWLIAAGTTDNNGGLDVVFKVPAELVHLIV